MSSSSDPSVSRLAFGRHSKAALASPVDVSGVNVFRPGRVVQVQQPSKLEDSPTVKKGCDPWRLGVPIIHSLRDQTPPLCDSWLLNLPSKIHSASFKCMVNL